MSTDHYSPTDPNPTPPTIDANDELIAGGMTVAGTEIMVFNIPGSEGYKRLTVGGNSIVLDGWTANHLGQALAGIRKVKRIELPTLGTEFQKVIQADIDRLYNDDDRQHAKPRRYVSEDTLREELLGDHPPMLERPSFFPGARTDFGNCPECGGTGREFLNPLRGCRECDATGDVQPDHTDLDLNVQGWE